MGQPGASPAVLSEGEGALLERLRSAQRVAGIGTFEWNLEQGFSYWSPELYDLLGLADGACAPSMERWYGFIDEAERSSSTWRFFEACLAKHPEYHAEHCMRRADGGKQYVRVSKTLHFDAAGKLQRVVGAAVGINELRSALMTEQRSREAALESVSIVAHDLGNPLSAISASSFQLARSAELDPQLARLANRIHTSAVRMSHMLEQLLDVTRLRVGGPLPLHPTPFDLAELLADLCDEIRSAHPDRAPQLEQLGEVHGSWDRERLGQLISNLLGNAVQHGTGAPTVQLDGTDPDCVTLRVHNAGQIPAGVLPHIFEPFVRGSSGRKKPRGLGLGLYIAQQIASAHGGEIRVDSRVEQGTTFHVRLPRGAPAQ